MKRPQVNIYTDGACSNGRGGWAASLYHGLESLHLTGNEANTTNNRMEMLAVIKALEVLTTGCEIDLYSDSQYVLEGVMARAAIWKRTGWKTKKGDKVKNQDLWEKILELKAPHRIRTHWVKGHNGDINNETVDSLAQLMRQKLP